MLFKLSLFLGFSQLIFSYVEFPYNQHGVNPQLAEFQEIYSQYLLHYKNKVYPSPQEYNYRFSIFSANLNEMIDPSFPAIKQVSFAGLRPYQPIPIIDRYGNPSPRNEALNGFSDLTSTEFQKRFTIPVEVFQQPQRKSNLSGLKRKFPLLGRLLDKIVSEKRDIFEFLDSISDQDSDDKINDFLGGLRKGGSSIIKALKRTFRRNSAHEFQDFGPNNENYSPNQYHNYGHERLLPVFNNPRNPFDPRYYHPHQNQNNPYPYPHPYKPPGLQYEHPYQDPKNNFAPKPPNNNYYPQQGHSPYYMNYPYSDPKMWYNNQGYKEIKINNRIYPTSISYKKYLSPPLDQGDCSSCYIFGPLNLISLQYSIKYKEKIALSQQEPLDCLPGGQGCEGGDPFRVLNYVVNNGVNFLVNYPYFHSQLDCKRSRSDPVFNRLGGFSFINPGVLSIMSSLRYGAVGIIGYASKKMKNHRPEMGVFSDETCMPTDLPDHVLIVYGYNLNTPDPYFLVQNTWGREWSDEGSFKMRIGSLVENNYLFCGFAATPHNFAAIVM